MIGNVRFAIEHVCGAGCVHHRETLSILSAGTEDRTDISGKRVGKLQDASTGREMYNTALLDLKINITHHKLHNIF